MTQLTIELANDTELEAAGRDQLQRLTKAHDLTPFIFTDQIRIESYVIPHSHPVLTLNTRYINNDDVQLTMFLHEQLHWWADQQQSSVEAAVAEFQKIFPEAPIGGSEGGSDAYSTYLHLVICPLELDALSHYLGPGRARQIIGDLTHYTWVYDKVLNDYSTLKSVLGKHGLKPPTC